MKITKEQYDALTTEQKKLWKKDGEEYSLVGDTDIASEMRRARDREKAEKEAAQARITELEERLTSLEGDDARKSKDINAIEAGWQKKLDKVKADAEKLVATLKQHLERALIGGAIDKIAAEIFMKPDRDKRLLADRVTVEYDGDVPSLKVKDKDGKVSSMTLDDLKKETVDNAEFGDILVGSKASGSGGTGGNNGSGASKQPKDYTEAERVHLYKTDRATFDRLFPAKNGAA